jgi:hypothetical protein
LRAEGRTSAATAGSLGAAVELVPQLMLGNALRIFV